MKYLLAGEETDRILFREINLSDFNDWLDFHKDPTSTLHWVSDFKSPEVECENWYKNQFLRYENDRGGMNAIVEKETGELIGHCGLLVQTVDQVTELEIAYSLISKFRNKGLATEAARKCLDFAFENDWSQSLISIISLTNEPSENVARKNGMHLDRETKYKGNEVNIFRIDKLEWANRNPNE